MSDNIEQNQNLEKRYSNSDQILKSKLNDKILLNNSNDESSCSCNEKFEKNIYSLGRLRFVFPDDSVYWEVVQSLGRIQNPHIRGQDTTIATLLDPEHRYLLREICWVFTINNVDTFILKPRDVNDYYLITKALRTPFRFSSVERPFLDLVIGQRGPLSSPETCGGLTLPIVKLDQIYTFNIQDFKNYVYSRNPGDYDTDTWEAIVDETVEHILLINDNTGEDDLHRAINYVLMRIPYIYERAAIERTQGNRIHRIYSVRKLTNLNRIIIDVIFHFIGNSNVKYAYAVDVTGKFPFGVGDGLRPYMDPASEY
jgi:hypothetical protein